MQYFLLFHTQKNQAIEASPVVQLIATQARHPATPQAAQLGPTLFGSALPGAQHRSIARSDVKVGGSVCYNGWTRGGPTTNHSHSNCYGCSYEKYFLIVN